MAKRKYMAKGYQGVTKGGRLDADLRGLSDDEKRRKKLEQDVKPKLRKTFTTTEDDTSKRMLSATDDKTKIRRWTDKAATLKTQARESRRTGNTKAADTFDRVAKEYIARIAKLKGKAK